MGIGIRIASLILALSCAAAKAADLSGTWQSDGKPQRVLKIQRAANGYRGTFHNLGDEAQLAALNIII